MTYWESFVYGLLYLWLRLVCSHEAVEWQMPGMTHWCGDLRGFVKAECCSDGVA